jgi:hypothetical protein
LRFSLSGYGMAHVILQPYAKAIGNDVVRGTLSFDLPPPQFNPPSKTWKPTAAPMVAH